MMPATVRVVQVGIPDLEKRDIEFHCHGEFSADTEGCRRVLCWMFFLNKNDSRLGSRRRANRAGESGSKPETPAAGCEESVGYEG